MTSSLMLKKHKAGPYQMFGLVESDFLAFFTIYLGNFYRLITALNFTASYFYIWNNILFEPNTLYEYIS